MDESQASCRYVLGTASCCFDRPPHDGKPTAENLGRTPLAQDTVLLAVLQSLSKLFVPVNISVGSPSKPLTIVGAKTKGRSLQGPSTAAGTCMTAAVLSWMR